MVGVMTPCTIQHQPSADLAHVMALDMAVLCQLTSHRYFQHVSKAVILETIGEFAPDHVTLLAKLTKGDIVNEAERLNDDSGRMPAIFRAEGPSSMSRM
jgi:ParB family chromosome partitioning protein